MNAKLLQVVSLPSTLRLFPIVRLKTCNYKFYYFTITYFYKCVAQISTRNMYHPPYVPVKRGSGLFVEINFCQTYGVENSTLFKQMTTHFQDFIQVKGIWFLYYYVDLVVLMEEMVSLKLDVIVLTLLLFISYVECIFTIEHPQWLEIFHPNICGLHFYLTIQIFHSSNILIFIIKYFTNQIFMGPTY